MPADLCAAAIRHISLGAGRGGWPRATFHLGSPGPAGLGSLAGRLRAHGFAVRAAPFGDWVSELIRYAARHPSHPMTPFLPLFVDRDPGSGLTPAEMYLGPVFPGTAGPAPSRRWPAAGSTSRRSTTGCWTAPSAA